MFAARYNSNPEVLKALLETGVDAKAKNNEGRTALDHARENEKLKGTDALKLLEERTNSSPTEDLLAIAGNAGPEKVRQLIQAGADVNAKNKDGWTPLMIAAALNSNPEVLKVLLEAGADVNAQKEDGVTPLMVAAIKNTPEVLKVLIEAGADVNAKDTDGLTPLMLAAQHNPNPKALTALLEAGADAKTKNNEDKTALDYARMNEKLKDTPALKLLEEKTGQN